jgi:hypothetical protein
MAATTEIAPDIYRVSIFAKQSNLQFNHFLVKDDEPLLFHTGLRGMHTEIREAVSKPVNLFELRHISFSHFESDECGSLNEWLLAAPNADVICSQVGALTCLNDFTGRESRALADGGAFATGKYRFRYCRTPHLPHGWDAGVLFEETQRTLLCSDLFHQIGDVEPYPACVEPGIRGLPGHLGQNEMYRQSLELVQSVTAGPARRALERFDKQIGTGHASADIEEIVRAASTGRVEHLFLLENGVVGDGADLLDRAALGTLRHGGDVHTIPQTSMPSGKPICAIFRYVAERT